MNFTERRKQVFDKMDQDSALLLFSGIELHVSADEYLPFEANRNFFYLTGLRRDHMILMMKKTAKEEKSILFIEKADPSQERWFGRKVTVSEAQEITGIDDVRFLDSFEGMVNRLMARRSKTLRLSSRHCVCRRMRMRSHLSARQSKSRMMR